MNPPSSLSGTIDGVHYNIQHAKLLAGDNVWNGSNFEQYGRNTFLYRSKDGKYFTVTLTQWQDERDKITPVSRGEAKYLFERVLTEHYASYAEAFPA